MADGPERTQEFCVCTQRTLTLFGALTATTVLIHLQDLVRIALLDIETGMAQLDFDLEDAPSQECED